MTDTVQTARNRPLFAAIGHRGAAILCLILGLCMAVPVVASDNTELQSHAAIREAARVFLREQMAEAEIPPDISIGNLDPRLRLAACEMPLQTFMPEGSRNQGRTTVGVRCTAGKPWTLYLTASIRVYEDVVVATHPLPRGKVVDPSDVELARREVGKLTSQYLRDPARVTGLVVKRSLRSGDVINPLLLPVPMVKLLLTIHLSLRSRKQLMENLLL